MARFILDVNNMNELQAKTFMSQLLNEGDLVGHTATIVCIDWTNNNQFHEEPTKNTISSGQISTYNMHLVGESAKQDTERPCLICENVMCGQIVDVLYPTESGWRVCLACSYLQAEENK